MTAEGALLDMRSPGVRVEPLRQMTGDAEFNEVWLDEVRVADADRVGEVGGGWSVALTTLMNERATLGGGAGKARRRPIDAVLDACRGGPMRDGAVRDRMVGARPASGAPNRPEPSVDRRAPAVTAPEISPEPTKRGAAHARPPS